MTAFSHGEPGTSPETWASDPRWACVPAAALTTRSGEPAQRLVVVAAHPDDETLGAGGLLAAAHEAGLATDVVVLTAGEASHPHSPTHPSDALAARRRAEAVEAVRLLAPSARLEHAELPDGGLEAREVDITTRLVSRIGDGRHTLLVAPWRRDGHPDHEAAGRASRVASARTGATSWEYPVWFWHWAEPEEAPWSDLVFFPLSDAQRVRKRAAVAAHRTQVAPLSSQPGDEVLLPESVLAHFAGSREVFVRGEVDPPGDDDRALDDLHRGGGEPWEADERWYERRKRQVLLASLPAHTYDTALELGCSTGVLAADLAERCRELVAVDTSGAALQTARRRLRGVGHARLEQHDLPWSWPDGAFDLVVLSEVGYFLSPVALDRLIERVRGSLTATGTVVLCHWRHEVVGWVLDGPTVHDRFREAALGHEVACYRDRDVEILVLAPSDQSPDPTS